MNRFLAGLLSGAITASLIAFAMWPESTPAISREIHASDDRNVSASDGASSSRESPGAASTRSTASPASSRPPDLTSPGGTQSRPSTPASSRAPLQTALEIPGGKLDGTRAATPTPQDALLDAFRVRCTFGAGAGGNWPAGRLMSHTAAWQGGPIDFDSIDLTASTARMLNDSGVTGSTDGALDVRVTPTGTGLHFTAFNPRGDLLLTSVYAERNASGAHRAVFTMNGRGLNNESAQFYGSCTL